MFSKWFAKVSATSLRGAMQFSGALLVLVAFTSAARAVTPPPPQVASVPEINPSTMMGALTLLSGGLFLLGRRIRRK